MRRASTCLALLGLAILGLPALASAAPTVTFKVKAVPLAGFPGTGNILGAGAAVQAEYKITGTEYPGGFPAPLIGVNFYTPAGTKLHPQGFVTCPLSTLEGNAGPEGCPKKSQASPVGIAGVANEIGGTPVTENATLQAFFAPGGGLNFYVNGSSPISAQIVAKGHFVTAAAPYGPELVSEVPLVEALPGAPDVSTTSINIKVGAAFKQGKKTISYGYLPKKCPKGGFPVKSELKFLGGAVVTVNYKAPCPKK
ncbi:MAG: hypothetical protein ACHQDY_10085 [Solirubrobacterales bacterium]